jgi:hypothetical protein
MPGSKRQVFGAASTIRYRHALRNSVLENTYYIQLLEFRMGAPAGRARAAPVLPVANFSATGNEGFCSGPCSGGVITNRKP